VLLVLGRMAADNDDGRWCRIYEEQGGRTVGWEASEGSLRTSGGFCVIRVVKGRLVFGVFGWSSEENREVLREGDEKIRRGELE
jgi:hypothetical protein